MQLRALPRLQTANTPAETYAGTIDAMVCQMAEVYSQL